jgi:hypothetical protein
MIEIERALTEAGLLPEVMPQNFTYRKVREVLTEIDAAEPAKLSEAIKAAARLNVRSPLALVIFIKHHLVGAHEVEVDRLSESDEQDKRFAVLVYPEGEVPISTEFLPDKVREGARLHYDPDKAEYSSAS